MKSTQIHSYVLLSVLTLLLCQLHTTFAYTLTNSKLYDLQSTNEISFKAETEDWTASTIRTANKYTVCGSTYLLGGYNVLGHTSGQYFQRIYTNLPSHTQIDFSLVFWSLDNWSSDDKFELKFDSTLVTGFKLFQRTGLTTICGDTYPDLPSVRIDGKVAHSDTSLTFRVISQLASATNIESFGIRDIVFTFSSPATPDSTQICAAAPITLNNEITTCACPAGQYEQLTHSGKCASCHSSCAACTGGSATQCTSCPAGRFLKANECVACDKSCGTCNGTSADSCLTCATGYRKVTKDGGKISCAFIGIEGVEDGSFLNAPTESGKATFIVLSKTTQYVRTLDMSMSPRLQLLASSRGREILSLRYGFQMPQSMQEKFGRATLPTPYERQTLHSNFLVNYWQELVSQGIILAIGFMLIIAELFCQAFQKESLQKGLQVFRVLTAWNFCFILLATSLGDVIIFSYLQFSTFSSSTTGGDPSLTTFGLAINVIVILIMIAFLGGVVTLVKKTYAFRRGLLKGEQTHISMVRWDGCRVAYEGLYTRRTISRLFFFIYTIRLGLPSLVSIIAQSSPIAQTILQLIINVLILVYIFRVKPLRNRVNHIQIILIETLTLLINFFVFILSILATSESDDNDAIITLGDIVIVFSFLINLLIIIFMVIKLLIAIREIKVEAKDLTRTEIVVSCLRLLSIVMQQGGMGFEEAFEDYRQDDDYETADQHSPSKISPVMLETNSARDSTLRGSIARHIDDEDPKSSHLGHSNIFFLPSLADQKSRASIMKEGLRTDRADSEMDETQRKHSELPPISTNIDSRIEAISSNAVDSANVLSRATLRPDKPKRGKSNQKKGPNPEEDKFFMYKEKQSQHYAQADKEKKKKKKKNGTKNASPSKNEDEEN